MAKWSGRVSSQFFLLTDFVGMSRDKRLFLVEFRHSSVLLSSVSFSESNVMAWGFGSVVFGVLLKI